MAATSQIYFRFSFGAILGLFLLIGGIVADDVSDDVLRIQKASNQTLLWGPYRPNVYFGIRPRIPKSLLAGLMWYRVDDYHGAQTLFRHTCEQHELSSYGWDEYDVRTGGRQSIRDAGNGIDITTEFVKVPGGEHGGNWAVRVKGTPRADYKPDVKTSVIFYTAMEGGHKLAFAEEEDPMGYEGSMTLEGEAPGLGHFSIEVTEGPKSNKHPTSPHETSQERPLSRTLATSVDFPEEALFQTKNLLFSQLRVTVEEYIEKYGQENPPPPEQVYTLDNKIGHGNLHMAQKVFQGAFEFDILYSSGSAPEKMTSKTLTDRIGTVTSTFSKRFLEVFKPQAPFSDKKYEVFSKSLFSNLVGGIGYFYGNTRVDRSYATEYEEENEGFWEEAAEARSSNEVGVSEDDSELFTCIPSRPFFPRGFLWDEGFHLLPVVEWDIELALDIVKSWFNLIDEDGWIGREQILGGEARSKVPPEFQVQYPHYANPPTLFFVLTAFLDKLESGGVEASTYSDDQQVLSSGHYNLHLGNREAAVQYLKDLYPLLKRHYYWFRKTQFGEISNYDREAFSTKEAYRWRGRTPQHILTSGLDDYPRAQPPHPGELHVDLISWVGMMCRSLKRIAHFLGEDGDASALEKQETAILRNIEDLHWNAKEKAYCDATIDDFEESVHVCHKGYVSLFPFMNGLLPPDSPRIGAILDLISDPEQLWSDHGIRSLSFSDDFYGLDENYWRSPVWVNMNFLIIRELHKLATTKGKHKKWAAEIYTDLRKNLVDTVYESWKETGFAWEQYNPETGKGQRTQHFTGWTSLVVNIMAMPDLSSGASDSGVKDEL